MAQFDADIKLKVAVENLEASVRKVENAFKKVQDYRVKLKVDGQSELKSLGNSFKRLGRIVQTSGIVTAVAAITGSLQSLNNLPLIGGGLNTSALGNVVSQLGAFSNAAADAAASAPGLAAGIAASTAALIAFAPQIGRAVKDTIKIGKVAAEAGVPLKKLLTIIGAASSAGNLGGFENAERGVEEYRRRLYELNETVSELGRRQDKLKSSLNNFNSGSATAEKIARKLVDVTARYNEELREQADLLRRVAGVNVTELEASKGRNSIETSRRREDFLVRQSQEQLQVQKALAELDQRRGTLLERELGIEREVTAVVRQRAQYQSKSNQAIQLRKGAADEVQRQVAAMRVLDKSQANIVFNTRLQLALSKQLVPAVTKATEEYNEQVAAQKRLNSLLEQGNRIRKEYASDRAARKQAGSKRAESLALGVGFPLLFGGGAGSIAGSAAGSFVGKDGFGGQILGGAIGQVIDQYIQGLTALAQSLESTQGVIKGLEDAGYSVSAATKGVIESYQSAGLEAEAYQLAISEINRVLGPDGASKLSDYRIETENLSKEFEKAKAALDSELLPALTGTIRLILQLKGAFDTLADSPLFKFISGLNNAAATALPGIGPAIGAFGAAQDAGAVSGNVVLPESQRLAQEDAKLKKLTEQTEELTKQQEKQWEIDDTTRRTNETLEAQIAIERAGTDIKDDNVYKKRQEAIEQVYLNALIDAGTNAEKRRNAELAKTLALLKLDNQRTAALSRGGGGGGVDKEAQTQKAIAAQLTKQFELETKLATIGVTKLDKINTELERLDQRKALKVAELELSKEDERIKAIKLENLNKETEILRQQLKLQRERAQIEQQLTALKGEQQIAGLQRGLSQELAGLTLPSGDSFQDERDQLALKQQNRYSNAITEVNDLIAQQQLLATNSDKQIADAALEKLELLERQKNVYETMLPAIAQAEQQQLKFNQTLSLVEGPVNAFVSGLTAGLQGIIDGTMTAEEAFANMLKGMADALIQTATQMIAQYIAIGIARAFAGMGSSTPKIGTATNYFSGGFTPMDFFRAEGGPVQADRPYVVGERGPEFFVPSQSGSIVTNEQSKAAMSRYSASNDNTRAQQNSPIVANVNYNGPMLNFNGDEYIPRSEASSLVKAGAKQGEAMTLARLQNSRSSRAKLGL